MTQSQATPRPDRIDHFFSFPGARNDRWRSLHVAARDWARGNGDAAAMRELFDGLSAYEGFFAYPGRQLLETLRQRIESGQAAAAAALAQRISESILTRSYKSDAGDWQSTEAMAETPPDLNTPTLARGQGRRPYFEMLVVAPGAARRGDSMIDQFRRLRRSEDAFIYETVPVGSFEEAICAVILNPALAAVTRLAEGVIEF